MMFSFTIWTHTFDIQNSHYGKHVQSNLFLQSKSFCKVKIWMSELRWEWHNRRFQQTTQSTDSSRQTHCRYPYEFEGSHIREAVNIWNSDSLLTHFFQENKQKSVTDSSQKRKILIFHCEFSLERGPTMLRFLRRMDRQVNSDCYPSLYYPEIYLLQGGYKAFYSQYRGLCVPQEYTPMVHHSHSTELKFFRAKAKMSTGGKSSKSRAARSRPLRFWM